MILSIQEILLGHSAHYGFPLSATYCKATVMPLVPTKMEFPATNTTYPGAYVMILELIAPTRGQ